MNEKQRISTRTKIPVDFFNFLLKECFGKDLIKEEDYKNLITSIIYPLYYQFANITSLGGIILIKGMFPEKEPLMLASEESLQVWKEYLKTSKREKEFEFGVSHDIFRRMVGISYHGYEIMEFDEKGITDEEILNKITENALAYYYCCLSQINQGKRIGYVGYKRGKPDLEGKFTELDMQEFIPNYDNKKTFSIDENDFLDNMSEEEAGERLVDMISDFHEELNTHKRTSVLTKMLKQIGKYSSKVGWDSSEWLKKTTGKDYESFLNSLENPYKN